METLVTRAGKNGYFEFDNPMEKTTSTPGKVQRVGWYVSRGETSRLRALHTEYGLGEIARLLAEITMLTQASGLGAGPTVFDISVAPVGGGCAAVAQEYVGVSLERAIFHGDVLPGDIGASAAPLHPLGCAERAVENLKIMFDVLVQVRNLHLAGLYHRDLRAANVCVKRCGAHPQDIRATVIDFDNCGPHDGRRVSFGNDYFETLFGRLPRENGFAVKRFDVHPFDLDMAYCQALAYEVSTGRRIGDCNWDDLRTAFGRFSLVSYADGRVRGRDLIDKEMTELAYKAGLQPLDRSVFSDPEQLKYVEGVVRHGGFADAYDRYVIEAGLSEMASYRLLACAEDLARMIDVDYNEHRRRQGKEASYADWETSPYKESNIESARYALNKVQSLGYRIASIDDLPMGYRRVTRFTEVEVEFLAWFEHVRWLEERTAAGWTLGEGGVEGDPERKVSPWLVPWDELPEEIQEINRNSSRRLLGNLERLGFAVVDPRRD